MSCYSMMLTDDSTALERVAGLLRRRGHRVVRLSLVPGEESGFCRLVLEVLPKAGRAERILPELAKLESVWSVQPIESPDFASER